MRIPLTRYGLPQVVIFPAAIIIVMIVLLPVTMAILPPWAVILIQLPLAGLLVFALSFFRDRTRTFSWRPPTDGLLI